MPQAVHYMLYHGRLNTTYWEIANGPPFPQTHTNTHTQPGMHCHAYIWPAVLLHQTGILCCK